MSEDKFTKWVGENIDRVECVKTICELDSADPLRLQFFTGCLRKAWQAGRDSGDIEIK